MLLSITNGRIIQIMKKLSPERLANAVLEARKAKKLTQDALAGAAGINRSLISRLEKGKYQSFSRYKCR